MVGDKQFNTLDIIAHYFLQFSGSPTIKESQRQVYHLLCQLHPYFVQNIESGNVRKHKRYKGQYPECKESPQGYITPLPDVGLVNQ